MVINYDYFLFEDDAKPAKCALDLLYCLWSKTLYLEQVCIVLARKAKALVARCILVRALLNLATVVDYTSAQGVRLSVRRAMFTSQSALATAVPVVASLSLVASRRA